MNGSRWISEFSQVSVQRIFILAQLALSGMQIGSHKGKTQEAQLPPVYVLRSIGLGLLCLTPTPSRAVLFPNRLLVMHEQIVSEVGVVTVEPQIV